MSVLFKEGREAHHMDFGSSVQIYRSKNVEVAYRHNHNWGKPAIVLLHGMAETSMFFWDNLVNKLQDDYHIVAMDLLGHGDSSKPLVGYGATDQAQLYMGILDELDIEEAYIMGHSLGGIVGCQMAVDYPERVKKLVLYDAPIPRGPMGNISLISEVGLGTVLAVSALAIPGAGLLMDLFVPVWLRKILIKSVLAAWHVPFAKKNFTTEFAEQAVRNSYFALEQSMRALFLFNNMEAHLPKIVIPTLVMIGEKDLLLSVQRAQTLVDEHLSNSELKVIERAGHVSLIDQPDIFVNYLRTFLERDNS